MNFDNLINQFLPGGTTGSSNVSGAGSDASGGKLGGMEMGSLAAGAALGGLTGLLAGSKSGRRMSRKVMRAGRSAAGVGGLALIGGLAYKAYSNYKSQQAETAESEPTVAAPSSGNASFSGNEGPATDANVDSSKLGMLIVRSMIAAALADGELDQQEEEKIFGQINETQLSKEEQDFLFAELKTPLSASEIVAQCGSEDEAIQVYAAVLMTIEVDTLQERKFVFDLKQGLNISEALAASIEAEVAAE